jgi:hypothetical protein
MNSEWHDALSAFFDPPANKNPDPKPLANLLRGDQPIPKIARSILAEAIDQTLPFRGNWRLPAPVWDGALDKSRRSAIRDLSIAHAMENEIREGAPTGKTAETVSPRFGIGERQVMNIWSDWKDAWVYTLGQVLNRKPKRKRDR